MCETSRPSAVAPASGALPVTAKKGASSICLSCSSDLRTVATSCSGKRSELPRPGKCLAIASRRSSLPRCRPVMKARPISPTQNGSPPKTRVPKSPPEAEEGWSSTSSEGPKYKLNPSAASSCPASAPTCSARSGRQVAPSAISEGRGVSPLRIWSVGAPLPSCAMPTHSGT